MAEAGWYRVEEDPPGTVRRWNGEQWIGVPIAMEGATAEGGQGPSIHARHGVLSSEPVQGLSPTGSIMAVVAIVGFIAQAAVLVSLFFRLDRAATDIPDNYFNVGGISDLGRFIPGLTINVLLALGLAMVTSVAFVSWLNDVVGATRALTPAQMRGSGLGGDATLKIVLFLVFGLFFGVVLLGLGVLIRVWRLVRGSSTHNRAKEKSNRPSLLNIVNLVIEKVNTTGKRDVGPIKVLVWWTMLWAPLAVGAGAWLWAVFFGNSNVDAMPQVLRLYEFLVFLLLISVVAITSTVAAISHRLGVR